MEERVQGLISQARALGHDVDPLQIHVMLLSQTLVNWRWYIQNLTARVKSQVNSLTTLQSANVTNKFSLTR